MSKFARASRIGTVFVWLACAPIAPDQPSLAQSPESPVAVWLVERTGRAGHEILARNNSGLIHRIASVTLHDCVNVQETCGTHRLNVVLCPGEEQRIFAIHLRYAMEETFFNWRYTVRAYEPNEPVQGADCK